MEPEIDPICITQQGEKSLIGESCNQLGAEAKNPEAQISVKALMPLLVPPNSG